MRLPTLPFDPSWVHSAFVAFGTVAAVALFLAEARRRRTLDDRLFIILTGSLFCGAVAAKLSTAWRYFAAASDPTLLGALVYGGKSVLGGLAGAYLGAILTKRLIGYRASTGDVFAPAVALGIGIGRFGCLLTETPGTPTGLSWGVTVDAARAARIPTFPAAWIGVPLHPSFVYEIVFHFTMLAVLLRLRRRPELRDELFKIYLLAYAAFRFLIEFVRGNEVVWAGLTRSQLFLIPSTLLLAAYFVRRFRLGRRRTQVLIPLEGEP
ncbi:MAG TPA: prolipoprotein diacylglyceryl transferase family protein [Thermoanaerobaculia bacterium]|nr:prolipoprotein diacylglyceryl transferase family protein [Thermoanaerobaculia bacterium]